MDGAIGKRLIQQGLKSGATPVRSAQMATKIRRRKAAPEPEDATPVAASVPDPSTLIGSYFDAPLGKLTKLLYVWGVAPNGDLQMTPVGTYLHEGYYRLSPMYTPDYLASRGYMKYKDGEFVLAKPESGTFQHPGHPGWPYKWRVVINKKEYFPLCYNPEAFLKRKKW